LGVEDELYALLIFDEVLADVFSWHVVRALRDFRAENAGVVAGKENGFVGCVGVALRGQVSGVQNGINITSFEERSIYAVC
jgi:hypothetical protein